MDNENIKNKDVSLGTSPDLLFSFLPSRIRGVYLYDQKLSEFEDDNDARAFVEIKLRFLPEEQYQGIFKNYFDKLIDKESLKGGLTVDQFQRSEPNKYKKYFEQYTYFSDHISGGKDYVEADNFLEAEFVKRILSPILSAWGLLQIEPQKEICGYWVDFATIGEKKYVFEIDGFGKFKSRQDLDDFLRRQNEIINHGWTIYRFSYSDIIQNTNKTRRYLLNVFLSDPRLNFLLENKYQRNIFGLHTHREKDAMSNVDPIEFVNDYYKIQDFFVNYVCQNHLLNSDHVIIKDALNHPFPMVALSLSNLYKFLSGAEALLNVKFDLPSINVFHDNSQNGNYIDYFDRRITVSSLTAEGDIGFDINMDVEKLSSVSSSNHLLYQDYFDINFRENLTIEEIKKSLAYFTSSIFRYDDGTKEFQNEVLQSIFDKKEVLGIFPTGSGKSFCFWLPALLKPGLTVVICPLRSLMRDQIMTLEHFGIASASFINSDIKPPVKQRSIINDAKLGRIKILYVAPERIRIKKFLEAFSTLQEFIAINYLVIDEAHCISEWGHDFRPSYLNIPFFYDSVKAENPSLQIIALTATAGPMVRADVMNTLKIKEENLSKGKNLDRKNFSYQIVKVDGYQEKQKKFKEIIKHWIPRALSKLSVSDIHDVLEHRNSKGEKAVGLIYVIYADPHGKHSIYDGIAHYLYETKKLIEGFIEEEGYDPDRDYGKGRVRAFSSKVPTLCPNPKCGSYRYTSYQNRQHRGTLFDEDIDDEEIGIEDHRGIGSTEVRKGVKICLDCNRKFTVDDENNVGKPHGYEKVTKNNQYDFKHSMCDILVATKGFGMGIDKGSVRFALHTSFASGIESWYQEAGRAGRDEERAHCVILADLPNERCYATLLEKRKGERGIAEPECNQRKCPHGKESACDYGKQHIFIKRSYPSVEADLVSIIKTLDKIINSFISEPVYEGKIIFKSSTPRLSKDEIALFRLMLLGIVKEFSVYYESGKPYFEVTIFTEPTKDGKITIRTNDEEIKRNLVEYLNKNILYQQNPARIINGTIYREGQTRDIITQFKEKYDQNIIQRLRNEDLKNYVKYEGFYHRLIDYLLVLLDHAYSEVLRMRYGMLWDLLTVMKSDKCRRAPILSYFHDLLVEDYNCGLCDNCVTDLNFERMERIPPKGTEDIEELKKELEMAFERNEFIYENLLKLRNIFKDYPESIRGMARSTLTGKPDNLVALYFLREFSPTDEKEANTHFLIRQANKFLSFDDVVKLYESSDDRYKKDLLLILDDEDGRFNNQEGMKWLYDKGQVIKREGDKQLKRMGDKFGFYFFCIGYEQKYMNHIDKLKNQIREVYHGGNN